MGEEPPPRELNPLPKEVTKLGRHRLAIRWRPSRAPAKAAGALLTILSVGPPEIARQIVEREAVRHAGSGVTIETAVVAGEPTAAIVEAKMQLSLDSCVHPCFTSTRR